jgi:predicted membrane protein
MSHININSFFLNCLVLVSTALIVYIYYINHIVTKRKIRRLKKGERVICSDMYVGEITNIYKVKNKYSYKITHCPYWFGLDNVELLEEVK